MFKRVSNWIARLPWWGLLLGGPALIVAFSLLTAHYATSDQALEQAAPTPEMKRAIRLEREKAARELGLRITKQALEKVERVIPDPEAKADIEDALREIEQATREIEAAKASSNLSREEAREQIDEAKRQIAEAKKQMSDAKRRLKLRAKTEASKEESPPAPPAAEGDKKHGISIDLNLDEHAGPPPANLGPLPELAPELKQEIRNDLRFKVYKVGFSILAIVVTSLLFLTLIPVKIGISINRALKARAARSQAEAQRNKLEKQLVEARLAAMQAQIEPHFLFNTLASVQQLIESDPQAASRMQTNLIKYLRAAIPKMRDSSSTLRQEVEMAKAYLNILKIRMEDRLQFDFAIPVELENAAFPPMMIATLVENAIKHGLEPKPEGGRVDVYARVEAGKLRVTVADTGLGFSGTPGSGVGLANIRERLEALYGKAASLIIEDNAPHGAKLTIEIPEPLIESGR
jgi:two-component sensor histidine kinase